MLRKSVYRKKVKRKIKYCFTRAVIINAPKNAKTRKSLEASNIAPWKINLNEQKDFENLDFCRNGAT